MNDKQNRMNEMREQVRQLKEQHALTLKQRTASAATSLALESPAQQRAMELYAQLARVKEQLLEENAGLQQMLAEQNILGFKLNQLHLEFEDEQVRYLSRAS